MYYLDGTMGRRRRALARDKVVGTAHDLSDYVEAQGTRAADHLKGVLATGRWDRTSATEPQSDAQLQGRIRARLGRLVSHPKSVEVEVRNGTVLLGGHVLASEVDGLLSQLRDMTGVKGVQNKLMPHDSAEGIPELQGRQDPPGKEQAGQPAW
ncbi:BON domain-containing protein [Variovorax paradoxus]|nr:BON domain-containing protein [Variovorax paradoxus]